jgi:hypothetical protein
MSEQQDSIRILRETSTFSHISSTKLEVSLKLLLLVPPKQKVYTHFTDGYLTEVKVTDQQGRRLVMIPRKEFGQDFTENIRTELRRRLNIADNNRVQSDALEKMLPLPILLADLVGEEIVTYVEIDICYSITHIDKRGYFSQYIVFRHHYFGKDPTIYLTISVPDKYEFQSEKFSIQNMPIEELSTRSDHSTKTKVFHRKISEGKQGIHTRIEERDRPSPPNAAVVRWEIGAPSIIRWWARLGGSLGILSLIFAPYLFFYVSECAFSFIATFLGGIIALMIGLNVFLFHDIELMERWNKLYILVIIAIIAMLGFLGYHYSIIDSQLVCSPNS